MFALFKLTLALFFIASFTLTSARPLRIKRCVAHSSSVSAQDAQGPPPPSPATSTTATHPPAHTTPAPHTAPASSSSSSGCFPALGFNPPALGSNGAPDVSVDDWWCSRSSEYAFQGFSYGVDGCPSKAAMTSTFKQMRNQFDARYVRIYAACDRNGFYDDVVGAAYSAGIGVYSLVWFGFTGGTEYKARLNALLDTIENNPLAPYTIRNVALGSEPLSDGAITVDGLVALINEVKPKVSKFGIQVSVSEMVHGYRIRDGSDAIFTVVDHIESNTLPFFSDAATTGSNAWPDVTGDVSFYKAQTDTKKIVLTENGWPSNEDVWKGNVASAVASISSEKGYYDMLDAHCSTLKTLGPQGGIGWFAHIWDDNDLPGWGITVNGKAKFDFSPRTHC